MTWSPPAPPLRNKKQKQRPRAQRWRNAMGDRLRAARGLSRPAGGVRSPSPLPPPRAGFAPVRAAGGCGAPVQGGSGTAEVVRAQQHDAGPVDPDGELEAREAQQVPYEAATWRA